MADELAIALAQSLRWVIAGIAGAAFAKNDMLDRGFWYQLGYIGPLIAMLAALEYAIQILIVP